MCLPICSPMAPSPIIAVRFTSAILNSRLLLVCSFGRALRVGRGPINSEGRALAPDHYAVVAFGRLRRDIAVAHVDEHTLRRACEWIAVTTAAGRVEAEDVAGLERIVGVTRGQPLGVVAVRIDP